MKLLVVPSPERIRALREALHAWLDERALSVDRDVVPPIRWAFLSPEGKAAFRTWAAR